MTLFRPEAIEAKRRRLWGEVRLAQPPSLTAWTAVSVAVCVALMLALALGRYTRKETVQGFLAPEAGIVQVRPVQAGRIARVLVTEGAAVVEGAPLIEFTSDIASTGQGPMLDMQLAEAERQEAALAERTSAVSEGYDGERRRLLEQIGAQERLRGILQAQRQVQAEGLALSEVDADRLAGLQAQGFAPNSEVERRRRSVLSERAALADLDTRISQTEASIAELRSQAAAIPARAAAAMAELDTEGSTFAQRRSELALARGHVLRAPITGTVSGLQARPGMTPAAELPLLSISPAGSELEAHLLVPTRAAGFLKTGQNVRVQVEAFPFQRFGFVEGQIRAITITVVRPGEALYPITPAEPVYEIRVSLSRDYVDAYGERRQLRPGMLLRADIPIDSRRLWQQLFDPLIAAGKRSSS
ncbi:MAG: HlyD family efflux transporter periplasmic adaptor subunit [Brevundimonas sp.]|nr:HlyD family efflux transporter periplasmic adaptor subunit [Brevundimonas sp.]